MQRSTVVPNRPQKTYAIDRPLVPLRQMVKQTYSVVYYNVPAVVRMGTVPFGIMACLQILQFVAPTLANIMVALLGNLLATSIFAVALNRYVLTDEIFDSFGAQFGRREWRCFWLLLITVLPVFVISLSLFAMMVVGAKLSGHANYIPMAMDAGTVIALALASYSAVRCGLVFPAIALDQPLSFKLAWRLTQKQGARLWGGLALCLLPALGFACLLLAARTVMADQKWVVDILQLVVVVAALPLSIVFLALNYERLVLGRTVDRRVSADELAARRKARGNPAWQRWVAAPFAFAMRLLRFKWGVLQLAIRSFFSSKPRQQTTLGAHQRRPAQTINPAAMRSNVRPTTGQRRRPINPNAGTNSTKRAPQPMRASAPTTANDNPALMRNDNNVRMVVEMTGLDPKASALVHQIASQLHGLDATTIEKISDILQGRSAPPAAANVLQSTRYSEQETSAIIAALLPANHAATQAARRHRNAQTLNDLVKK